MIAALVVELRRAEIELGGWIEREDVPAIVSAEMMCRLQSIRRLLAETQGGPK